MASGEEKLKLVLDAIDKTAAPIRRVNRRIEKMTAPVRKVKNALGALAREARFDKLARGAAKLGRSLAKAATKVGLLAGAAAGFVGLSFAKAGIEAAAAYESLGVRLKVLTGNAEGARAVLEGIDELATRTPNSLEELGNVAASMSVIFKDNTERVSEFTALAADLAAAYGRPVEQIGENLQRAFSAGLGSADVLREAGISAEILRITGASKAADLSAGELANAFRALVAEGGPAFGAAAEQAATLGGALSNTQIALGNVQRELGNALKPLLNDVLLNTAIPLLETLKTLVTGNADAIGGGLARSIQFVTGVWSKLSDGFRAGFEAVQGVSDGGGELSAKLERLAEITAILFEKFGGWERVGQIVGVAVGLMVSAFETLATIIEKVLGFIDSISPQLGAIAEGIAPIVGKVFSVGQAIFGDSPQRGGDIAANAGRTNVGGRISIELDDRRARIRDVETSSPGVTLDLEGGEALAPS